VITERDAVVQASSSHRLSASDPALTPPVLIGRKAKRSWLMLVATLTDRLIKGSAPRSGTDPEQNRGTAGNAMGNMGNTGATKPDKRCSVPKI